MAPSHMESEFGSYDYTHKKFNCGYSHKKLGRRFVRRPSQEEMPQQQDNINCSMDIDYTPPSPTFSDIFRPYALASTEEVSSQKSLAEMSPETFHCNDSSMTPLHQDFAATYQYYAHHFSQQQSADAYALKLQRQRAALYMRHVMQYYDSGNGWPTMHPSALNNSHSC